MIWNNVYPIHWHIYAALRGDELAISCDGSLGVKLVSLTLNTLQHLGMPHGSILEPINLSLGRLSGIHLIAVSIDPIPQIPQCKKQMSHNATLCNRNVHMCTLLLQNGASWDIGLMHCGICATGLLQRKCSKYHTSFINTVLGNGWSPVPCQASTWNNADLLSIKPYGTYLNEIRKRRDYIYGIWQYKVLSIKRKKIFQSKVIRKQI